MGHFAEFSQQLLLSPFLGQEPETWDVARVTRLPAPEPGVALVFLASKSSLSHVQVVVSLKQDTVFFIFMSLSLIFPPCRRHPELCGRILGRRQSRKRQNLSPHLDHCTGSI